MRSPRAVRAHNESPFTLDGTRTYLVGDRRVAVIDPGPELPEHLDALARAVEGASGVVILQTHDHTDHAAAVPALVERLGAPVLGAGEGAETLAEGGGLETDHGRLLAVETPGHAARHLAFHWPERAAVFVGDLLLGEGSTTWLGAYPGCVADYFDSLDRIEALSPSVLYPAHGPPVRDVAETLERYREHRRQRLSQLRRALEREPDGSPAELVRRVYTGDLPEPLREAAERSVEVMLHHLETAVPSRREGAG